MSVRNASPEYAYISVDILRTDTRKLFHDASGYNEIRFVMILVNLSLDKGHYISGVSKNIATANFCNNTGIAEIRAQFYHARKKTSLRENVLIKRK